VTPQTRFIKTDAVHKNNSSAMAII